MAAMDDPRARIYIVDHLAPGTVIERRVEVSNSTTSPHQVTLYSSAATINDGAFVGAQGDTTNELSRWTTVTPGSADLASGEKRTAVVKIAVPSDAAPGEQYAVVWAEARSDAASGGVTRVSRVGIRLYVSVGPGAAPAPDFAIESLTPGRSAIGQPMVTATVHNTGGRAIDVAGTLSLSNGPGGLNAGPFRAALNTTLAVGDTRRVTITLDNRIPAGPWDAAVVLNSGTTERRGYARIAFPRVGEGTPVTTSTNPVPDWPVVAGGAAVMLAMGLAGLRALRRARRRRRASAPEIDRMERRSRPLA